MGLMERLRRDHPEVFGELGFVRLCGRCRCCGHMVVWLPRRPKLGSSLDKPEALIPVYLNTWDGNPYLSKFHGKHRKSAWQRHLEKNPPDDLEDVPELPQPEG